jgi:pyrroline-5-carboxylate reductase
MTSRQRRRGAAKPTNAIRRVGFIGGGNMAGALIRGLIASGAYRPSEIWVAEKAAAQRRRVERAFRVRASADNTAVAAGSAIVVLAVKPQVMREVLAEIRSVVRPPTLFISIAAGVRLQQIERALGPRARVVRVMPNTPALVGRGMSVIAGGRRASTRDVARTLAIFRAVGDAIAVPRERFLDPVTGLSGSGPAFVYLFAEGLLEGGQAAGLSPKLAERLAYQTIEGAVAMMKQTGKSPAELRAMVTSPGGTTLAGLTHLQSAGFREAVSGAVVAATARSHELARG